MRSFFANLLNTKRTSARTYRSSRRSGLTILEVILALSISAVVAAGAAYGISQRAGDVRDKAAATHLQTLTQAAQRWAQDNYSTLVTAGSVVLKPVASGATDANSIALAQYLPPNFNRNSYRQTWRVVVNPSTTAAGQIDVLVLTGSDGSGPSTTPIDPFRVSQVVGLASGSVSSGFFMDSSRRPCIQDGGGCTTIQGAYGSYSLPVPANALTSGIAVPVFAAYAIMSNATVYPDALMRNAVPGQPQLQQMNAPIDMSGNNISDVGAITLGATGNGGQIATDANGNVVISAAGGSTSPTTDATSTPSSAPITLNAGDLYVGTPNNNNYGATGNIHAQGLYLRSPADLVFYDPFLQGNTTSMASLDQLLPRERGQLLYGANDHDFVPQPTCVGNALTQGGQTTGIPQILTTLHAFEGDVTQEASPKRTLPMRVRASATTYNGVQGWTVLVEYLNPYPACNGGNTNEWRSSMLDSNCNTINERGGFVIAETLCYYPLLDTSGIATQTKTTTGSSPYSNYSTSTATTP